MRKKNWILPALHNHRGKAWCESFKLQGDLYDVLCHSDYAEQVVSSFFSHKSNYNIIAAMGLYLLKALYWNTSVHHTIPFHCWHQIICHSRRCFIHVCLVTENSMPQPHLNTVNALLKCFKTEQHCLLT